MCTVCEYTSITRLITWFSISKKQCVWGFNYSFSNCRSSFDSCSKKKLFVTLWRTSDFFLVSFIIFSIFSLIEQFWYWFLTELVLVIFFIPQQILLLNTQCPITTKVQQNAPKHIRSPWLVNDNHQSPSIQVNVHKRSNWCHWRPSIRRRWSDCLWSTPETDGKWTFRPELAGKHVSRADHWPTISTFLNNSTLTGVRPAVVGLNTRSTAARSQLR